MLIGWPTGAVQACHQLDIFGAGLGPGIVDRYEVGIVGHRFDHAVGIVSGSRLVELKLNLTNRFSSACSWLPLYAYRAERVARQHRIMATIHHGRMGTIHSLSQIIADTFGVDIDDVAMIGGDSAISTYGGGAWASRGIAIGGEAALRQRAILRKMFCAWRRPLPRPSRRISDCPRTNSQQTIQRTGDHSR